METIILQLIKTKAENRTLDLLTHLKRDFAKKNNLADIPSNIQLLQAYYTLLKAKKIKKDIQIEQLLKKRAIRSQSGIVSVQVLTKPFYCPGQCVFCPNDPTMPKSYIKSEPGAMRALLNKFDPLKQVYNRLLSLKLTGHETDKIEMIVLGGTFDVYAKEYKTRFIKELYDACNTFDEYFKNIKISTTKKYSHATIDIRKKISYSKTLEEALKKNENAAHRIIGLTIETRPEYVTDANCKFRRELGVTRVEMGLQSSDETVLKLNKRGHTVQQARESCHKLRQYGFKFALHIMPGLYGSSYAKDLQTFKDLYTDPYFKPDEIKFYPTSVIPNTELCRLYEQGKYKPLETENIKRLIRQTFLDVIPPYTRIKRLIRDIPANEIVAGSTITNLSQLMHTQLLKEQKQKPGARKRFYARLYGNYQLFKDMKVFLHVIATPENSEGKQSNINNKIASSATADSQGSGMAVNVIARNVVTKQSSGEEKIASPTARNDLNIIQTFIIGKQPDVKSFRDFVSLDTRSREIRHKLIAGSSTRKAIVNIVIRKYLSSVGEEYFISYEDQLGFLYGFTRLLLPRQGLGKRDKVKGLDEETAIIRELHVYGNVETLKSGNMEKGRNKVQHTGFGRQLMEIAEQISHQHKYKKLSVISGIGVRAYYKKLGYKLKGSYMVKKI